MLAFVSFLETCILLTVKKNDILNKEKVRIFKRQIVDITGRKNWKENLSI